MIFALVSQFQIFSTGDNEAGKLGQGIDPATETPTTGFKRINLPDDISKFNIGTDHVVAINRKGDLYAWGSNEENQLLNNGTKYWSSPQVISYFSQRGISIIDADTGDKHTIALDSDGNVYVFGDNMLGQLGEELSSVKRTNNDPVKHSKDIFGCTPASVYAELYTSYVVCTNGYAFVFGSCDLYKCGDGFSINEALYKPTRMKIDFLVDRLVSGNDTLMAWDKAQQVWAIGSDTFGQLCHEPPTGDMIQNFTLIQQLTGASDISFGKQHTIILLNGNLYGCGSNQNNQFSEGERKNYWNAVLSVSDVQDATATSLGTLIVKAGNISAIGSPTNKSRSSELGIDGIHKTWTDVPQDQLVTYVMAFGDYSFAFEEYWSTKHGLSGGAIFGIVFAVLIVLAGAGFAVWWSFFNGKQQLSKRFNRQNYNKVSANLAAEAENW